MGRPISQTLQELLDADSCETQSTLELRLLDGTVRRYATADDVVSQAGDLYGSDLRKTGEIVQSAFASVDRTNSTVENVDKIIGLEILSGAHDRATAIVGRLYRSETDSSKQVWVELFRGEAKPTEVNPTEANIEIVDDLVAAGYCVASQTLEPACPLRYGSFECGADPALPPCSHTLETCRILHRFAGMETKIEVVVTVPGDSGGGLGGGYGGGSGGDGGRECFVAGTLVQTPNGARAIEEIKPGDTVLSFNPETLAVETDAVTAIMEHVAPALVTLEFSGGARLVATPEHPFFTACAAFTPANRLRCGQKVFALEGEDLIAVEIRQVAAADDSVKVYNFRVARNETYFAGGIAVHNRSILPDIVPTY